MMMRSRSAWHSFSRQAFGLLVRPLAIVGVMLILFTAARLTLRWLYAGDFTLVPSSEYPSILLRGLRFDLSIILYATAAPLILMIIFPDRTGRTHFRWRSLWPWLNYAAFLFFMLVIAVDLVYFGHVHRHLGPEVGIAGDNFMDTLEFAMSRYGWVLVCGALAASVMFFIWRRLLRSTPPPAAGFSATLTAAALAAVLLYGGIRGGYARDRIQLTDAYPGLSPKAAILVLNGPYTAVTHFLQIGLAPAVFYPQQEALETVKDLVIAPSETVIDPDYPLFRKRRPSNGPWPNVVVILLESWSAVSVDTYRRVLELPPLGLTPNFDELSRSGVFFTRFFACGQRTRYALGAVLNGLPALPTLPYIGKGLDQLPISYLGRLARDAGYESYFFHPEKAADENRYVSAAGDGFDHIVSSEDVSWEKERFWDTDLYRAAADRLSSAKRPFLAFIMTSIPHAPYRRPEGHWNRFPEDSVQNAYYNALGFADWALGGFFSRLREMPDFERTLFIVLSDHVERIEENPGDPTQLFRIPCLVIAPGIPAGISEQVGSQVDVIPTICDLAGWDSAHASFGRSLFDRSGNSTYGALLKYSETMIRVEAGGWVHHSLRGRIDGGAFSSGTGLDQIERRLLSTIQVATRLCLGRRLAKTE